MPRSLESNMIHCNIHAFSIGIFVFISFPNSTSVQTDTNAALWQLYDEIPRRGKKEISKLLRNERTN